MESLLDFLQQFWIDLQQGRLPELGPWNYLLLALLIIWQGPIATLLGGAAASAGLLKPGLVFLVGVFGNLTADVLWYSLGRSGNFERVFEWRPLQKHRHHYDALRVGMQNHGSKILLLAKLSFGLVIPALVAAGITRLSWRKWFPVVFIGETIWTGSLVLLGYFATEAIKQIEEDLQMMFVAVSVAILAGILWLIPHYIRDRAPSGLESSYKDPNHGG